jgi:glutaminyl-tRNA synthetase
LFKVPNPTSATFLDDINSDSLTVMDAVAEPAILALDSQRFQFERQGYFCKDALSHGDVPVFNKTVSLREGF